MQFFLANSRFQGRCVFQVLTPMQKCIRHSFVRRALDLAVQTAHEVATLVVGACVQLNSVCKKLNASMAEKANSN